MSWKSCLLGAALLGSTPAYALESDPPLFFEMLCGCDADNPNDFTVDRILREFSQEAPGTFVQIINPTTKEAAFYKRAPDGSWRKENPPPNRQQPYVRYRQDLQATAPGSVPAPAGQPDGGGREWQPIYVAATVCAAGSCNTEWIIVGWV